MILEIKIVIIEQNWKNLSARFLGWFSTIFNNARHGGNGATL